jgi:putative flippase GtrA
MKNLVSSYFSKQFMIFVLVGMMNTLFGYSIFAFCIFLGLHYVLAVTFSTCLGILFSFKTLGRIVFKNPDNILIIRFMFVYFILYAFNIGVVSLLNMFYDNLYVCGAIATVIVALIAYVANQHFVFVKRRS